ncbi:MAG: TPM domain-containing protein [Burkholderiales bacterium]|nr:TPM domain-containing protein [Burkholderiales bacterium]
MDVTRLFKHLLTPDWIARRAFPEAALARVEDAIRKSERSHTGELRFAVEAGLDFMPLARGETARARARALFSLLEVWDTAANSGVLIYLQLVDRRIEILADRGIAARVDQATWDGVCRRMEAAFRAGDFETGALSGIREVTALLARHFPPAGENPNELPDRPVIL